MQSVDHLRRTLQTMLDAGAGTAEPVMEVTISGQESNDLIAEQVVKLERWSVRRAPAIALSARREVRVRLLATVLEHAREAGRKHGESVVLRFRIDAGRLLCEAAAYGAVR